MHDHHSERRNRNHSLDGRCGGLGLESLEDRRVCASHPFHLRSSGSRLRLAPKTGSDDAFAAAAAVQAPAIAVASVVAGPTPFISFVTVAGKAVSKLKSIGFTISPKEGSATKPISATYSRSYLARHSYVDPLAGTVTVPVYGLYAERNNTVTLAYAGQGSRGSLTTTITTAAWDAPLAALYQSKEDVVVRNPAIRLAYSYFMLKAWSGAGHPVVMDTDGEVRWAGTAGGGNQGSIFMKNAFYVGDGSLLRRIELDGSYSTVADYAAAGYSDFHHNIDPGKKGMLIELNHSPSVEADIIEADEQGRIVNSWDFSAIISGAMVAGGDDPSQFVRTGDDWFHNNAAAYWSSQNLLVASSRENFVIAVGYDDKQIKWILGDTSKAWYAYPSLRQYALRLKGGSVAPVGQHAVSVTPGGELMLFDNGTPSFSHDPAGIGRDSAVPRRYRIDARRMTAAETWRFEHAPVIYSPICSSIYQDGSSYLIDYASENWGTNLRFVGLDRQGRTGFEFKLNGLAWDSGWNATPIHLERTNYK